MKKIFHLGIIAIAALSVSSCSKSGADLLAKEQKDQAAQQKQSMQQKKITFLNTRNHHANTADVWLDASKVYPFINQPSEMQLGDPNNSLIGTGQLAVFYIVLSDEVANLNPTTATLSLIDDATGDVVGTYNMISYKDVGTVDAMVPAELTNIPFMCALITLDSQYTNRTILLSSHIEYNDGINNFVTDAKLDQAFTVTP